MKFDAKNMKPIFKKMPKLFVRCFAFLLIFVIPIVYVCYVVYDNFNELKEALKVAVACCFGEWEE